MMETTMIQLKKKTAQKLKSFKDYDRQSYDEIINRLIQEAGEEPLTKEDIDEIQQGLEDIRSGRVRPIEEVAKGCGISLKA